MQQPAGYGGVSDVPPQFMVDGMCSPFFPVAATASAAATDILHHHHGSGGNVFHPLKYSPAHHPFLHQHQYHQQPASPPPPPPQFHHFHQYPPHLYQQQILHHHQPQQFHMPITQQLFQQAHSFHLFQEEQQRRVQEQHHRLGLEESGQENPAASPAQDIVGDGEGAGGGGILPFLGPAAMSFRLSVNESSGGGSGDGLDGDGGGILPGGDDGSDSLMQRWPPRPPTPREQEDSAIKEPFWRPLDIDFTNRNSSKRCRDKQQQQQQQTFMLDSSSPKRFKQSSREMDIDAEEVANSATSYKLFSELEAICKPAGSGGGGGGGNNNQTGSSSALTGENPPTGAAAPGADCEYTDDPNVGAAGRAASVDTTSTGEEGGGAPPSCEDRRQKSTSSSRVMEQKQKRKERKRRQLSSTVAFFEGLVKQLIEHQEGLHRRFLELLERRDRERADMEEEWRRRQAEEAALEARVREEQQTVASAREAAIITFLEKLTGESLELPTRARSLQQQQARVSNADLDDDKVIRDGGTTGGTRWPRAEVEALIGVRGGLEPRFQEAGVKLALWEEVSSAMAAAGYRRSAKRCKEKWENINKYFRKAKESFAKKRPQRQCRRACPYFQQLDELYSRPLVAAGTAAVEPGRGGMSNSELLDAVVVPTDDPNKPTMVNGEDSAAAVLAGHSDEEVEVEVEGEERRGGDEEEDEEEGKSQEGRARFVVRRRRRGVAKGTPLT